MDSRLLEVDDYRASLTRDEIASREHMSSMERDRLRAVARDPAARIEDKARSLEELVCDEDPLVSQVVLREITRWLRIDGRFPDEWLSCLVRCCDAVIAWSTVPPVEFARPLLFVASRIAFMNTEKKPPEHEHPKRALALDTFCCAVRALSLLLPQEKTSDLARFLESSELLVRQASLQAIGTIFRPHPPWNLDRIPDVVRGVLSELERVFSFDLAAPRYIAYCAAAFEAAATIGLKALPTFASRLLGGNGNCVRFVHRNLEALRREWVGERTRVDPRHPAIQNLERCLERLAGKKPF